MVGNHSPFSIVKSLLSVQKKLHFTAIGKIWKPSIGLGFRHKRTQDDAFFHLRMEIDNGAIYQIITRISHKHANTNKKHEHKKKRGVEPKKPLDPPNSISR